MRRFAPAVTRRLAHYVYLYLDPDGGEVFYVGKGKGNRAFAHLEDTTESEKAKRIREIRERGREPRIEILAHGLTSEEAYRVEAAAIDVVGSSELTNAVRGWRSGRYGRMSLEQVEALYGAKEVEVVHPAVLIRIRELFRYGLSAVELYDITRGAWRIGPRREGAEFALAVFDGIVQEVYRIEGWYPAGSTLSTREFEKTEKRWEFVGRIAEDEMRRRYRFMSVKGHLPQGAQNPIRYVNV